MLKTSLSCTNISYSYGESEILHDISFSVQSGEVLALVGPNGVGKTTLLKILLGKIKPDNGSITLSKDLKIAYIPQEIAIEDINKTVKEYLVNVQRFELAILNLPTDILDRNISTLSGGEKSKINLLKLNQIDSDLYILDEPTNNLDAKALIFLEKVIKKHRNKSSFIIVSHDRQLLENTTDKIIEIDSDTRVSSIYPGPFSNYISLRKKKIENMWKEYNDYIETKRKLERSVQDKKQWAAKGDKGPEIVDNDKMARGLFRDWSTDTLGRAVKSAQDKLENLEKVEKPKETVVVNYSIELEKRSGDIVDVSEASIAKKRDEIFELGQKWAAIPPPFQKVLLDLYKVGSTADILEDLEKSQTLLDSPEFQNLIAQARAGQLPPDVQQSLADLLKFLSKSAPVQDPGKAGVQSKGGPAGDPQGQPQKGQDASQPKPGQKP